MEMATGQGADRQFVANHVWYDTHFEELVRDYHGKYVAVNQGHVVGSSRDLSELTKKTHGLKGVLITKVVRPEEEEHYLLL